MRSHFHFETALNSIAAISRFDTSRLYIIDLSRPSLMYIISESSFGKNWLQAPVYKGINEHVRTSFIAQIELGRRPYMLLLYFVKQKSPKKSRIFPRQYQGDFSSSFLHKRMLHPVALALENK